MNIVLKVLIVSALILLGGTTVQTNAQRCGGDFVYFLRDKEGNLIDDKEKVDLKDPQTLSTPASLVTHSGAQMLGTISLVKYPIDETVITPDERTEWVKVVRVQTHCGLPLAEIALEHGNQIMVLRFLNMPAETNYLIDSLPFQEGTFEIDFKSEMSLKHNKLNRDGLRHKDGKYFQRGTAKHGLLVSADNWSKITPRP